MPPARTLPALAFTVLATMAASLPVFAQAPAIPAEYPALRGGTFVVAPAGLISGGFDSNIHREGPPEGPIAASELFGVVGLQMAGRLGVVEANADTGAELVSFRDQPGEGGLSWGHHGGVRLDLARVRPHADVRWADTYARPSGFEIGERSRHQELTFTGGAAFRLSPRATLDTSATRLSLDYAADETYQDSILHETLSRELRLAEVQFGYTLSPLTTFSVLASRDWNHFRNDSSRDGNGGRVMAGLSLDPPAMLSGSGLIGIRWFEPQGANAFQGLVGAGQLLYARPSGNSLLFRFARDTQFSYDPSLAYYLYTDVGVTAMTTLGSRWRASAGGSRQWIDYRNAGTPGGTGRVDHRFGVGGMVGYRVGRWSEIGFNAEYVRKTGTLAFTGRRYMAYLAFGGSRLTRFDRPLPGELP